MMEAATAQGTLSKLTAGHCAETPPVIPAASTLIPCPENAFHGGWRGRVTPACGWRDR
jgi:hypothetical protein